MTILAVCGPIGSDFKAFSEQCYSFVNQEKTWLIDSSVYPSSNALLTTLQTTPGDIIVFGPEIFLNEQLRAKFDVQVFLDLDPDLCLGRYLEYCKANMDNLEEKMEYYFKNIKPLNEEIRLSAKGVNFRRPQGRASDKLIDLLINKDEKSLICPATSDSPSRDRFWKPAAQSQQVGIKDNTASFETSELGLNSLVI